MEIAWQVMTRPNIVFDLVRLAQVTQACFEDRILDHEPDVNIIVKGFKDEPYMVISYFCL